MPAIYSAQKVEAVFNLWNEGDHKFQIAMKLNINQDDIDGYMLAALKKFTLPKAPYKKRDNTGPSLFTSAAATSDKAVRDLQMQPTPLDRKAWATYSNKQTKY